MKAYKLNPLEQLQLEKKQLQEECKIAEQRMSFQMQYLADNWGSMVTKSVTSSIKHKFSDVVDNFTPSNSSAVTLTPYISKPKAKGLSRLLSSNYKSIALASWGIIKPMLWAYVTKRATSMIFGRKRRRK